MSVESMQSLSRQLAEDLRLRTGLTVLESVDGSGNPTLAFGTLTTTSQGAFLRLKCQDVLTTTSLGLAGTAFGPHVIQMVVETSTIAAVPYLTGVNMVKLLGETLKHGTKVEFYMSAEGDVPAVGEITAANLKTTWDSLRQPLTSTL